MSQQRSRWMGSALCAVAALLLLLAGWLLPVHLRGIDISVIQAAGRISPGTGPVTLADSGLSSGTEPVTPFLIRVQNREQALAMLHASTAPDVQDLLRSRELTNTVLFPASSSSSGQAFDAAVAACGLLLERGLLTPVLRATIATRADAANRGGDPEPLEEILMDTLSLGQRLSWPQLAALVNHIQQPQTLDFLASSVRNAGAQLPILLTAVDLSHKPDDVAHYLGNFSKTGWADLAVSERFGAGGVDELLARNQQLYESRVREALIGYVPFGALSRAAADSALRNAQFALTLKWFLYLLAGFFIAVALHNARPQLTPLARPLEVRGVHWAREILFALGFLLVIFLLSEPFLAQESQKMEVPFRLHLSPVGSVAASVGTQIKHVIMNPISLLTLLFFFILQGLIYTACVVKLAEIRRQNVPPRVKLKLLENEDHLFDAGLYLGFVGTIVSLILVSLGIIQFSLMAAYSSTSFGIIFVSVFKIFHVRPARRELLLQAEAENSLAESRATVALPQLVTTP